VTFMPLWKSTTVLVAFEAQGDGSRGQDRTGILVLQPSCFVVQPRQQVKIFYHAGQGPAVATPVDVRASALSKRGDGSRLAV
jgi:hypothetical protein